MPANGMTRVRNIGMVVSLGAYSANDVLGVGGYCEVDFGSPGGQLLSLAFYDHADEKPVGTIYVYDQKPVVPADNTAWSADAVSQQHLRGRIVVASGDWTSEADAGAISRATANINLSALGITFGDLTNNKLYLVFKVTNTPDYDAVTDLIGYLSAVVDV